MSVNDPGINRATHFSIVWAVVLAVLTLVEWHSLDRDPLAEQIFLPFIERRIEMQIAEAGAGQGATTDTSPVSSVQPRLQTQVEISFDGPLFLVYCFGPILVMHGIVLLSQRLRRSN